MKFKSDIEVQASLRDSSGAAGSSGQVLSSTVTGTSWVTPTIGTITGSGTTNYVSKFTGSTSLGNSLIYDNGTNVGINNTSPNYALDVIGSASISSNIYTNNVFGLSFGTVGYANSNTLINTYTGKDILFAVNSSEKMRVTSAGNVGIGTTAPTQKLTIVSETNGLPILGTALGGLFLSSTNELYGLYSGVNGITGDSWFQAMRNNSATAYNILLNPVGGNIGIGTASPSQLLHVAGNARITGAVYDSSNSAGSSGQVLSSTGTGTAWTTGGGGGLSGSGTTNYIPKFTGSTAVGNSLLYDNGTNVGVGTTSPLANFDVQGSVNFDYVYSFLDFRASDIAMGTSSYNGAYNYVGSRQVASDGQAILMAQNGAAGPYAKFGIQGIDSSTGETNFLVVQNLIKGSPSPSDPSRPVKWIQVLNEDNGQYYFLPMYQ